MSDYEDMDADWSRNTHQQYSRSDRNTERIYKQIGDIREKDIRDVRSMPYDDNSFVINDLIQDDFLKMTMKMFDFSSLDEAAKAIEISKHNDTPCQRGEQGWVRVYDKDSRRYYCTRSKEWVATKIQEIENSGDQERINMLKRAKEDLAFFETISPGKYEIYIDRLGRAEVSRIATHGHLDCPCTGCDQTMDKRVVLPSGLAICVDSAYKSNLERTYGFMRKFDINRDMIEKLRRFADIFKDIDEIRKDNVNTLMTEYDKRNSLDFIHTLTGEITSDPLVQRLQDLHREDKSAVDRYFKSGMYFGMVTNGFYDYFKGFTEDDFINFTIRKDTIDNARRRLQEYRERVQMSGGRRSKPSIRLFH